MDQITSDVAMTDPKMLTSKAVFVASTGRCGTQFLAQVLKDVAVDARVEHEPIAAQYVPRTVFRRETFDSVIASRPAIQNKLERIEKIISRGYYYVDTGWPTFAWIPYFQRRFGPRFEFVHLVRNPFETVASLLTHRFFLGRNDGYARMCIISAHDSVHYDSYSQVYDNYSPFEKGLFHWLEVNEFLLSHHGSPHFRGLFRFEELHRKERSTMAELVRSVFPNPKTPEARAPIDKFQRSLKVMLTVNDDSLINDVMKLSMRLGYDKHDLYDFLDLEKLADKYRSTRH